MTMETAQQLFFIDTGNNNSDQTKSSPQCAWVDEDDEHEWVNLDMNSKAKSLKENHGEQAISGEAYSERLRQRFDVLHQKPKWASLPPTSDSVENILSTPFELPSGLSSAALLPDVIEVQRLLNINHQESSRDPLISAQFHPSGTFAMVAGRSASVSFFKLDDKENTLLQKVTLAGMKPKCVQLSPNGDFIVATGSSRFIYVYNLIEDSLAKINNVVDRNENEWESFEFSPANNMIALLGNSGHIVLFSCTTKRGIGVLKMNGAVKALAFSSDGKYLLTAGSEHSVYIWNVETFKCVCKFYDDSGNTITALSVSPDDKYFVAGSSLGVVNVYDFCEVLLVTGQRKPLRTIMNLTTAITQVNWHPSGEILALSTDGVANGLRLLHVATGRVYSNWPNSQMPLGLVKSVSFSADGSRIAIACVDGKCRLYALNHYRK